MWPLPSFSSGHIYMIARADAIIMALLEEHTPHQFPLILKDYLCIPYHPSMPLSRLYTECQPFITKHTAQHRFIHSALMAPLIEERCFSLAKASPTPADFPPSTSKHPWHYTYLHALENGTHHFYACAIPPVSFFNWSVVGLIQKLHPATLTTSYLAMLNAYRKMHGTAFRHAQLAADMIRSNYHLPDLFKADTLARLLIIPSTLSVTPAQDREILTTLIGLFQSERSI